MTMKAIWTFTQRWRQLAPGWLILAMLLTLGMPRANHAQVLYGSIVGNVTDANGAAVSKAAVTIKSRETNLTRDTTTDESGNYSFATVQTGIYDITITVSGFKTYTKSEIPVTLNNVTRVDVTLEIGQVAESVTVSTQTSLLQTDRAEVRAELGEKVLKDLPVPLGRNYQNLFKTLPGFTPPANAHSIPTNPSRSLRFNVNGTSASINNTRIDGASTTNPWLPHITAYVPSLEAIETVNVVTNSFDAEKGLLAAQRSMSSSRAVRMRFTAPLLSTTTTSTSMPEITSCRRGSRRDCLSSISMARPSE